MTPAVPRSLTRTLLGILALAFLGAASAPGPAPAAPSPKSVKAGAGAARAASPAAGSGAIEWLEWGPAAFRKAILRDRPILLNIVVPWSRDCRDMDATWADGRIAAIVNNGYVPIRVDADQRPDIRERYPSRTWPAVTLVLPNGLPFYAVREEGKPPTRITFGVLPPERLAPILEESLAVFKDKSKRASLRSTVEAGYAAEAEPKIDPAPLDPATPRAILDTLRANFDALNGSWTKAPKFPMPGPIEACLFDYSVSHDPKSLQIGERALTAVLESPLHDKVGGGLHRLSASEDWSHPEYEKLLDRNAAFLEELLYAYVLTGKQIYSSSAMEIVGFLRTTLHRSGGGFYASQSFDPASKDGGAYYRASAEERTRMKAPPVEPLVLVGWSAKTAATELRAGLLFQRSDWLGEARETLDWLLANGYQKGRGAVHAVGPDGRSILPAFLEDQVLFGEGMLDSYELSGNKAYLQAAKDVAVFTLDNMRDPRGGLFRDILPSATDPLIPFQTGRHPYEWNVRMARLLARLFYLNPRERGMKAGASAVLEAYSTGYEKGPNSALYALARTEYGEGPLWIWVVGNPQIPGYQALLAKVQEIPELWNMVVTLDPADATDAKTMAQLNMLRIHPPAVYFSKSTHTSKGAGFMQEVMPNYRDFNAVIEREKAEQEKKAAEEKAGAPERPAGAAADPQTAPPARPRTPSEPPRGALAPPRGSDPAPAPETRAAAAVRSAAGIAAT